VKKRAERNTNCLAGMACPKCGSLGPFYISVSTLMCRCKACGEISQVGRFKKISQRRLPDEDQD